MRVGRGLSLFTVGVLASVGLPVLGGGAAVAAEPPSTIHVSTDCGADADGTRARPYCTIRAAAEVVQPGQTVAVDEGVYTESVVVPSGQPGRPITFSAYRGPNRRVTVLPGDGPAFLLSGVSNVVIDGFSIGRLLHPGAPVVIENSSDVTITNGSVTADGVAAVQIKDGSRRVTVSAMAGSTTAGAPVFAVTSGATDTLLAGNTAQVLRTGATAPVGPGIAVADAPRTTITNNTVATDCLDAVTVTGSSGGFALYNSVVSTLLHSLSSYPNRCVLLPRPDPASVTPLTVAGAASTDSRVDYNVVNPVHGGASYAWDGATYANQAAFHAATGQGAHDINAEPDLAGPVNGWVPRATSPVIDSALATAPGIQARDLRGNAHADKPDSPNSGGGYVDRGAVELMPAGMVATATIAPAPDSGPLETVVTAGVTNGWTADGPIGTYSFATGDERPIVNRTGSARLAFARAGQACAKVIVSPDGFRGAWHAGPDQPTCTVLGANYNAVPPQRVLDTRSALGAPGASPVGPDAEVEFAVPAAAAGASAVVLNITATGSSASGYLKVYPAGDAEPTASNLNYAAGQTIANLVTVKVNDGKVRVRNGGRGAVHVLADLAGYYANTGNGLAAAAPARVLDTRAGAPIGPHGTVTVDLSSRLPAGTTAAVVNLTATSPTNTGLFTAFPPGAAVPTASNLNFVSGQTVNNMVIAPVVDGKVAFAHTGKGTVQLIVDLAGWFAPGAGDAYLPTSPTRLLDTRSTSTPVGPGQTVRVRVDTAACGAIGCGPRTAVVANLTATGAQRSGYLTVYPDGQDRPTQSVLNFAAGQTVASLFTAGLGEDSFLVYNGGKSTVDVLVDQAGFYLS
ncbi:right-handed parallel beta-helix repeat-containing protein [Asanoa siamensis]|uniref:DUF1565 domain-containing protein n=1 Tax=Asanoa siamensis TaxID=926357 RepID=A0ABQ4CSM1_9ACTN|nr:right-handed parallel beta-helix repeat-containing protein [Asanoa siamensis]GIF74285.1 hypothetical protein Asi02nite_38030 [Asanoa siamensis]